MLYFRESALNGRLHGAVSIDFVCGIHAADTVTGTEIGEIGGAVVRAVMGPGGSVAGAVA